MSSPAVCGKCECDVHRDELRMWGSCPHCGHILGSEITHVAELEVMSEKLVPHVEVSPHALEVAKLEGRIKELKTLLTSSFICSCCHCKSIPPFTETALREEGEADERKPTSPQAPQGPQQD
jgi:hypothetical protein